MTILNLYMGGGRGLHRFSPLHRRLDPCLDRRLDRCLDPRLDRCLDRRLDPCASLCPSIEFFVFFGVLFNYVKVEFGAKIAFPSCIFRYRLVCAGNLASQQQKSENQKILHNSAPLETQKFVKDHQHFRDVAEMFTTF